MDKFRMMFQFLQSNQESFMHGICGIMALASAQLYAIFEFNCPCLPEHNYSYGIGIMVVPAIWFFLLGFVLNNNVSILAEEWKRPPGPRGKDMTIFRYLIMSVTQRSLIAPAVWICVTLMDGKTFLCAYSMDLDISQFGNVTDHGLSEDMFIRMLATIPCEDVFVDDHIVSRDAAVRYIKCVSQAFGWLFLLILTVTAFLIRAIRPCFSQAVFLKTKYWSHYNDVERKMFDEICTDHAKSFAKVCIQQYFESYSDDKQNKNSEEGDEDEVDGRKLDSKFDDDKMMGIYTQEDINKVLWDWHICKPPLSLKKEESSNSKNANGHMFGYDNASFCTDGKSTKNGYSNGTEQNGILNRNAHANHSCSENDHLSDIQKKQWAVYYSKV